MDARQNGREIDDIDRNWRRLAASMDAECPPPALSDFERWVVTILVAVHAVAAGSIAVARFRTERSYRAR